MNNGILQGHEAQVVKDLFALCEDIVKGENPSENNTPEYWKAEARRLLSFRIKGATQ